MIYAFRYTPLHAMLVEFSSQRALERAQERIPPLSNVIGYERTSAARAHAWVKSGCIHETALWTDDNGRIRRA